MRVILSFFVISVLLFLNSQPVFANSVILNEFMAHPDDNTEWVELYNPTNQIIDLSNWKIKDGNSLTNDDLTLSGQVNPLSFITFDNDKSWLNNTGNETITLLDNNSQLIDSYTYTGTTEGKTYGRQPDGLTWITDLNPSKGSSNGEQPTPTPTPTPTPAPTPTKTPTPTPTPKKTTAPTSTPTITPSPVAIATESQSPTPASSRIEINYRIASVAAVATQSGTSASNSAEVEVRDQRQTNPMVWIGFIFIFVGIGSMGYITFKKNAKIHLLFRR